MPPRRGSLAAPAMAAATGPPVAARDAVASERPRPAAQPRGRAVGPRRDPALRPTFYAARHRGGPEARRLLPRPPPRHLRRDARRSTSRAEPIDVADRHRAPAPDGQARGGRRPGGGRRARRRGRRRRATCASTRRSSRSNALLRRLLTTTYEIQASVDDREAPRATSSSGPSSAMLEVAQDDRQKDFRSIDEVLARRARQARTASPRGHRRSPARRPASRTSTSSPAASSPAT